MKQRETGPLIGDREECRGPVSDQPQFGWRVLELRGDAESSVIASITSMGIEAIPAGRRNQSYDLRVPIWNGVNSFVHGIEPGNYEVKSLWRKNDRCSFDPRFKMGRRGERIYGNFDSALKAFAVELDDQIETIMAAALRSAEIHGEHTYLEFFDSVTSLIDNAKLRRHSRGFIERMRSVAQAAISFVPDSSIGKISESVLSNQVQALDIVRGFVDLKGIFIVAGPMYTLVTATELGRFLSFDSVSSEGLKLRYNRQVPATKR